MSIHFPGAVSAHELGLLPVPHMLLPSTKLFECEALLLPGRSRFLRRWILPETNPKGGPTTLGPLQGSIKYHKPNTNIRLGH